MPVVQYPFKVIPVSELHTTIQQDSSEQFFIRLHLFSEQVELTIDKSAVLKLGGNVPVALRHNAVQLAESLEIHTRQVIALVEHNKAPVALESVLDKLYTNVQEHSYLVNYLMFLYSFSENNISCDIIDILKLDERNLYKELSYLERLETIKNEWIRTDEILLVGNTTESLILIQNPIYRVSTKTKIGFDTQDLLEAYDNIYYRVDVYGTFHYVFFHPYLDEIHRITGIDLRNVKPNIQHKEYLNLDVTLKQV